MLQKTVWDGFLTKGHKVRITKDLFQDREMPPATSIWEGWYFLEFLMSLYSAEINY